MRVVTTGRAMRIAAGALIIGITTAFAVGDKPAAKPPEHPFRSNVKVEVTDEYFIVHSDGIPDHTTGDFPNRFNPNTIKKQNYTFRIPRHPQKADEISKAPMGPIGVAINGVPFYNPYNAEGQDAAKNEVFDDCCGHPDPAGRYHYHIYPKCIHTSFHDEDGKHSPLIGYAFDGFAIYGPNGEDGKAPTDLDECNGHTDEVHGYHYHVSRKFPYILGGYHGVVEESNFDGPVGQGGGRGSGRGPGGGGPGGGRGPGGGGGNGPDGDRPPPHRRPPPPPPPDN